MSQAYEAVRGGLWQRLDDEHVHRNRALNEVFGDTFRIGWNHAEREALKELLAFCRATWPDRQPEECVAALIRTSFTYQGKVFQILKHWVLHNREKPTLRTYLTLGGSAENPERRTDVLNELAANPRMGVFLRPAEEPVPPASPAV
mgnify:CR=1 FL=1